MRTLVGLVLVIVTAGGCVYPHRSTSLTAVHSEQTGSTLHAPESLWQVTIVSAHVRPRNRGDLDWDDGGGLPDVFVRLYRGEELLFETETVDDTLEPVWNATPERNLVLAPHDNIRFEVWDDDTVGGDPVGIYRNQGLPANAVAGADARLLLEGGSYLTVRVAAPIPRRGVGIDDYEVRPDALVVIRVLPYSPASRAGIEPGHRIVAIGDQRVSALSDAQAASALSMAVSRGRELTVQDANERERSLELDSGFVWLIR